MNPLNNLPFDINTLIPETQFNWDVVEGMDAIHNDTQKVYERITTSISTPLDQVVSNQTAFDQDRQRQLTAAISPIEEHITNFDRQVTDTIDSSLQNQITRQGLPGAVEMYWLVMREQPDGKYTGLIERSAAPPSDNEWYGPYQNGCTLGYWLVPYKDQFFEVGMSADDKALRQEIMKQVTYQYTNDVVSGIDTSNPDLNCWQPLNAINYVSSPTQPITTTTQQPSFEQILSQLKQDDFFPDFTEDDICKYQWRVLLADFTTRPWLKFDTYVNQYGQYLTQKDVQRYQSWYQGKSAQGDNEPCKQSQGATSNEQKETQEETPQETQQQTTSQTTTKSSNQVSTLETMQLPNQVVSFDKSCCDAIVKALTKVGNQFAGSSGGDEDDEVCRNVADEAYQLSECAESDYRSFLLRHQLITEQSDTATPLGDVLATLKKQLSEGSVKRAYSLADPME